MPSIKRIISGFVKKKNHGSKFHEFHGYDNLRHSAYPLLPGQQHNPAALPPHSSSHRHQLYPQQFLQQTIQTASQCPCQNCSTTHQQTLSHQASQLQMVPQPQPQMQMHPQPQIQHCQPTHLQQQQQLQQHYQQQQQQHQQPQQQLPPQQVPPQQMPPQQVPPQQMPSQQLPSLQMPQQQIPQQQMSQQLPQQLPQQQQPLHYPNPQHYVSQTTQLPSSPMAQCVCQTCPHQQQHQQFQQQMSAAQQSQLGFVQMNGSCHPINQAQLNQTLPQQYQNHGQVMMQQMGPSHPIGVQLAPLGLQPTTPSLQQQQQQQQQQLPPTQMPSQQFQYHTIQPQQYEQQKQQYQMQQHQRVQSMHQQAHPKVQPNLQPHFMVQPQHQIATKMESQLESHDFYRYANMQSLLDSNFDSLHTQSQSQTNFQEHVYCNQKAIPDFTLPPYEAPPNYATFIEQKRAASDINGQHMTYHSESTVWERTKESGYENLRTKFSPYSNLGIGKQEPGYTS